MRVYALCALIVLLAVIMGLPIWHYTAAILVHSTIKYGNTAKFLLVKIG